jgi:hypothetical protein
VKEEKEKEKESDRKRREGEKVSGGAVEERSRKYERGT